MQLAHNCLAPVFCDVNYVEYTLIGNSGSWSRHPNDFKVHIYYAQLGNRTFIKALFTSRTKNENIIHTSKEGLENTNGLVTVTNYEYEVARNEKKRRIRILYPELLSTIEHEVKALFKWVMKK